MSPVPQTNPCCPTPQPLSPKAAPQSKTCPLNQLVHTGVSNADCNMHIGSTPQPLIVHQIKSSGPKPQPLPPKPTRATLHHNPIHQTNSSTPSCPALTVSTQPHTTTLVPQTNPVCPTPNPLSPRPTRPAPHHNPYPPNQLVHSDVSNADYNMHIGPTQPLSTKR